MGEEQNPQPASGRWYLSSFLVMTFDWLSSDALKMHRSRLCAVLIDCKTSNVDEAGLARHLWRAFSILRRPSQN